VYVDVTLTHSKVKVKVTGLLNFLQLPKLCMLAAMTAATLRGFLVFLLEIMKYATRILVCVIAVSKSHNFY